MSFPAYPAYKTSGVEWLGEVPIDWALSKVKYDSYVKARVGWHGLKSDEFTDVGPYLVTGSDFKNRAVEWASCYHCTNERFEQDKYIQLQEGDLLITKDGTIGKLILVEGLPGKATLNSGIFVVRPLRQKYSTRFYFWIMQSSVFHEFIGLNKTGSTIIHLYQETFESLPYALPPLAEQIEIARFLDHETAGIDALIEEQQRLIELLKKKRQAEISHAVTKGLDPTVPMKDSGVEWLGEVPAHWPLPKLGHLARVLNGSTPSRENMDYWSDGDIPWVASGSLNDYRIDMASEFITKKALKECSVELIPSGAILVGLVGQGKTRGLAALLNIEATINQNVCAVVPDKEKVLSGYLHLYLHCIYEPLRDFGRGANQAALNCELVSVLRIPLPCMEEQSRIVKYIESKLNEFDALEDYSQRSIGLMQERRSALISAAVTGKIDVRGWQSSARAPSPELAQEAV
ncbi:restriction endonuclease subunit S [Pseudomonas petrae]|uniref:Restriction endonuclease subunit S n=1 Tax=Pseudomonas petrae TaxID=2912190 RepID=A0ABS9ICV7_9PSED|nr:restriction endonuclease subunit S [Pseudomonas petrae]MCF7545485.1 restriction endonuclease subunit S [Pseudomonas petrae]